MSLLMKQRLIDVVISVAGVLFGVYLGASVTRHYSNQDSARQIEVLKREIQVLKKQDCEFATEVYKYVERAHETGLTRSNAEDIISTENELGVVQSRMRYVCPPATD